MMNREVSAYQDEKGVVHARKSQAIASDLYSAISGDAYQNEIKAFCNEVTILKNAPLRRRIIELLTECDK